MEKVISDDKIGELYEEYVFLSDIMDDITFSLNGTVTCVLGDTTLSTNTVEITDTEYRKFLGDCIALYCGYESPEDDLWLLSVVEAILVTYSLGLSIERIDEDGQHTAYLYDETADKSTYPSMTIIDQTGNKDSKVIITSDEGTFEVRTLDEAKVAIKTIKYTVDNFTQIYTYTS